MEGWINGLTAPNSEARQSGDYVGWKHQTSKGEELTALSQDTEADLSMPLNLPEGDKHAIW